MNVWLIFALVIAALAALTRAYFDLDWRAFISDVQNVVAGALVLAAALGATAKISAQPLPASSSLWARRLGG